MYRILKSSVGVIQYEKNFHIHFLGEGLIISLRLQLSPYFQVRIKSINKDIIVNLKNKDYCHCQYKLRF